MSVLFFYCFSVSSSEPGTIKFINVITRFLELYNVLHFQPCIWELLHSHAAKSWVGGAAINEASREL